MEEDAAKVLEQVGRTYLELSSYSDRGYKKLRIHPGTKEEVTKKLVFSTHFKRPNFFRFEWQEEGCNVVWCDGKRAFKKYDFDDSPTLEKNLSLAVAGATGVSAGTAHTISALLMEEVGGNKLTDMTEYASYLGVETHDGEDCHHLYHAPLGEKVFISKLKNIILKIEDDYVIRAGSTEKALRSTRFSSLGCFMHWLRYVLEFRSADEDTHWITTTVYEEVKLNPDIPDEVFSFEGPGPL